MLVPVSEREFRTVFAGVAPAVLIGPLPLLTINPPAVNTPPVTMPFPPLATLRPKAPVVLSVKVTTLKLRPVIAELFERLIVPPVPVPLVSTAGI